MNQVLGASDVCTATLMAIPMFKTTYPNKVFDYMAAGRATILGIDGVIREVVEKAEAGTFIEPGDDSALAQAVLNLYNNRETCDSMGQRGRSYVSTHFNRATHAAEFVHLIKKFAHVS